MSLRIPGIALTVACLLVGACSSSAGKTTPDTAAADTADVTADTRTVFPDVAEIQPDLPLDLQPVDTPPPPPDCGEYPRPFACPCELNDDCMAGYCAFHLGEKVCSVQCIDECPTDWKCELAPGFGADEIYVCISNFSHLCLPCAGTPDCPKAPDHCIDYGEGAGFFCGAGCQTHDDCPSSYACTETNSFEGVPVKQCMTIEGPCACSDHASKNSLGTSCINMNEVGACLGWRFCAADGLTQCDAPEPVEEVCFNETDDDCNGIVDDGENCCFSDCTGKECGDDGCGASCGDCGQQDVCSDLGQCVCVPDCEGKECGSDGCNSDCGTCAPGTICTQQQCAEGCQTDADCPPLTECIDDLCLADLPDGVWLLDPTEMQTIPNAPSESINARVFEQGLTDAPGQAQGLFAQYGCGPAETDPTLSTKWLWQDAVYDGDDDGSDLYSATLTSPDPGAFSFTFRFSLDGEHWTLADTSGAADGWNPEQLGSWIVPAPPEIDSLDPSHGSVLGGTQVAMTGKHIAPESTLTLDGVQVPLAVEGDGAATFTTPAHTSGTVGATLQNPDTQSVSVQDAFTFVLEFTATVDATLADWTSAFQVGSNDVTSNWDPDLNKLTALYAAYDSEFLYIAVDGYWEPQNYLVGYVDIDFGQSTGVSDILVLGDNNGGGDLDDALSNLLNITAAGFGAEFGFGAQGDADFTQGTDLGQSSHVGWRKFTLPYDFSWVPGTVLTDQAGHTLEASIPLAVLYQGGVPAGGSTIALFVRIIDHFGNEAGISNQTLPGCQSDTYNEVCNVATLLLLP